MCPEKSAGPPQKAVARASELRELLEVKKRPLMRRSRKEEYEAYGRSFEGCGMQGDYDVTTKLGEGTFGRVWSATSNIVYLILPQRSPQSHSYPQSAPCRSKTNFDA